MDYEQEKEVYQQQKLMKKSAFLIISFFLFLISDMVLFMVLQKNPLFMFNLNRSEENMPNPYLADIFTTIFYTIILIALIVYLVFLMMCLSHTYRNNSYVFKKVHSIADLFSVVPIFLFIVIVVNGFFFSIAQVDGVSMQPTFCSDDAVVIIYHTEISRDDILIISNEGNFIIKRVVGLPGDKLVVNNEGVYINDVLVESYIPILSVEYDIIIPENQFYVLGDNRLHSSDSRLNGLFEDNDILGEVKYNLTNGDCE